MTKSNFLEDLDGNLKELRETLKAKTFEPTPVQKGVHPKPSSGQKTPLGIPTRSTGLYRKPFA